VVEFAVLAAVLFMFLRHSFGLFWLAVAILTALPLLRLGPANDLMTRASIPALTMLLILSLRVVQDLPTHCARNAPALLLFTLLAMGGATAGYEFWRAVAHTHWRPDYARTLLDVARGSSMPNYLGKLDRADLQAVLKPATPVRLRR
jgi:hypothetical protein